MPKSYFSALCVATLSVLITVGCDRSRSTREISEPPLRAGSPMVPINNIYVDDHPSISADGTRVVFVSGRASAEGRSTLKVFKAEWPEGGAPAAPARLTTVEDLAVERDAVLAPDGGRVLISASIGSRNDLFLAPFDASSAPLRLTDDAVESALEIDYAFSADSRLIAWISRNLDAGMSVLKLVELDADGKPGTPVTVKTTAPFVSDFLWLPTATGYAMAIGSSPQGAGKLEYEVATFADLAGAEAPSSVSIIKDIAPAPNVMAAASSARLLLARRVIPLGSRAALQAGDFVVEEPQLTGAKSEPLSLDYTVDPDELKPNVFTDLPGTEVLALGMTADNSAAFILERNAWQCASDGVVRYGSAIVQATPDLTAYGRIVPRMGTTPGTWEAATEYCDRARADQTLGAMDDRITSFRVNAAATSVKFRMVYVSRFSAARDKDCNYLLGDPEVLLLDIDSGTRAIHPLSSNLAPLESAPRGEGQAACAL